MVAKAGAANEAPNLRPASKASPLAGSASIVMAEAKPAATVNSIDKRIKRNGDFFSEESLSGVLLSACIVG